MLLILPELAKMISLLGDGLNIEYPKKLKKDSVLIKDQKNMGMMIDNSFDTIQIDKKHVYSTIATVKEQSQN